MFPLLLTACALLVSCSTPAEPTEYQLFYLGGQSNMDGYGYVNELPSELNAPVEGVRIFHGNMADDGVAPDGRGVWSEPQPGQGGGFTSDGRTNTYGDRFGVELTFARRMRELRPDARISIIKYSRGGTSLDIEGVYGTWAPEYEGGEGEGVGINQYDHFLATVENALSVTDIDGDGVEDVLIPSGIVWMQGESDAGTEEIALRYEANLTQMMALIRTAFGASEMPVVIGRISDSGRDDDGIVWTYGDIVRTAQASFVERDGHAALVTSTDDYEYSDPWHYDTAGFIDLGRQFAEALVSIGE